MGDMAKRGRPAGVVLHGGLLRDRRVDLGLSQAALADLSRLGVRTVRAAEKGDPVSPVTAQLLTTALGLAYVEALRPTPRLVRERLEAAGFAPVRRRDPWVEGGDPTLAEALDDEEAWLVVVEGPEGAGKSSLVHQYLRERDSRHPDGVVWVSARGLEAPLRLDRVRAELADCLGFGGRLPDPTLVSPDAYSQAFAGQLWRGERLLVLEGVPDPDVVTAFTQGAEARVIATTSRRWVAESLAGMRVAVEPWPDDRILELLALYVGRARFDADLEGTQALLELIGGLPLYARLAATGLHRARHRTLADWVAQVRYTLQEATEGGAVRDPVTSSLLSTLADTLGPTALRAVRDLGLAGEGTFGEPFAQAIVSGPMPRVREVLDELTDAYLLTVAPDLEGRPRFQLAGFAVGTLGEPSDEALSRVLSAGPALLAAWVENRDYAGAHRALSSIRPFLDAVLGGVLRRFPSLAAAARSPAELPARIENLSGLERLPEIVCGLAPWLRFSHPRDAGAWLSAALAMVPDDSESASTLAWMLGWWWFNGAQDREAASVWANHAVAKATGARRASMVLHAGIVYRVRSGYRDLEGWRSQLLSTAGDPQVPGPLVAACFLQAAGVDLFGSTPPNWGSANEHLAQAADVLAGDPSPRARLLAGATVVNRAVVRHALGEAVDVEATDAALIAMLEPIPPEPVLWAAAQGVIGWLGGESSLSGPQAGPHYLRLDASGAEAALNNLHQVLALLGCEGLDRVDDSMAVGAERLGAWFISGSPVTAVPGVAFPLFLPMGPVRALLVDTAPELLRFARASRAAAHPVVRALEGFL